MALNRPVLTRLLVKKTMCENGEKSSVPTRRPLVQTQDQNNSSLRQYCYAMDYRTSQTDVTSTKISC